uniref:ATP-grasp domain-containing protein n=1 Tax=Ignisphaera aggregans TaxID=334771 RepID=A0A7C5UVV7_9CREN
MKRCVVIASIASRKSLAIAKSIKSLLNYNIVGVAHTWHPHLFSTVFRKRYLFEASRDNEKWPKLVAYIAYKNGCEAVIPVDFIDFIMFSKYSKLFNELDIVVTTPRYEDITIASNRVKIVEHLKHVADFPKQVFIKDSSNVEAIYSLSPPLVVKGLGDSSNPSFHSSYETTINEASMRAPCIVQEYVEGHARGYYALSYNGIPIMEFTHQRIVEYLPVGGASLVAKGPIEDPELYALGRRILKELKWSGIIMVETRYSDEHGKHYVLELNPKFWGSIDLPVSLKYHFPVLLLISHTHGVEKACEVAEKLTVKKGGFVWVLDGFRYLSKLPSVWLYMMKKALSNPLHSDANLCDFAKNFAQFIKAFERIDRESQLWMTYLEASKIELGYWVKKFIQFLNSDKKVVIFDLDATLVNLPVNWKQVKSRLINLNLVLKWESINRAMTRLWLSNVDNYFKLSRVLEEEELKSIEKLNESSLLVPRSYIEELRRYSSICIATKQSVRVAEEVLKRLRLYDYIDVIIGRDNGVDPIKVEMYRRCIEVLGSSHALVLDDNIEYVVDAYRKGFTPMLISDNVYKIAKSMRLGIPAGPTKTLVKTVLCKLRSLN